MEYTQVDMQWAEGELKDPLDFLVELQKEMPEATNEIGMTIKALADNERFTAIDWFGAVLGISSSPKLIDFHNRLITYAEDYEDPDDE